MPTLYWLVDDTSIELIDRGETFGVTLVVAGERRAIQPMTLATWLIAIPDRSVVLEAKRNLSGIRYQLVSDHHLVPRRRRPATRDVPAPGTPCSAHDAVAVTRCPRCTKPYCCNCAPDGNHCRECLHALIATERAAIKRVRRIGIAGSFAMTLAILAAGLAMHSQRVTLVGFASTVFVIMLVVGSLISERTERRAGTPPAIDTCLPDHAPCLRKRSPP